MICLFLAKRGGEGAVLLKPVEHEFVRVRVRQWISRERGKGWDRPPTYGPELGLFPLRDGGSWAGIMR